MKIEIKKSFVKDTKKLSKPLQIEILKFISELEKATNLDKFDIKKMVGHSKYYRIRIGNYRIGFSIEDDCIFLVRVAKRDEIYKIFP